MAKRWPNAFVIALEPNPLVFRYLLWNLKLNNLTSVVWPLCAGMGSTNDLYQMQPCTYGGSNGCWSSDKETVPASPVEDSDADMYTKPVPVTMVTLSDLFAFFRLDQIDIFNIDCEGCEYKVFSSFSWRALHQSVLEIAGEYGNYHFSTYKDLYNTYKGFEKGGWRCEQDPKLCTPDGVNIFLPYRKGAS